MTHPAVSSHKRTDQCKFQPVRYRHPTVSYLYYSVARVASVCRARNYISPACNISRQSNTGPRAYHTLPATIALLQLPCSNTVHTVNLLSLNLRTSPELCDHRISNAVRTSPGLRDHHSETYSVPTQVYSHPLCTPTVPTQVYTHPLCVPTLCPLKRAF